MNHPILGQLVSKEAEISSFEGEVIIDGSNVGLNIELDSAPQDQVLMLAEKVVASISILQDKAAAIVSRDLLEAYNSGWNEYDEVQEDGSTKAVVNPKLDSNQFISQFELDSISICGADCVEFWYKPNDLFWGHSVFVTSFDGLEFKDANAQMFG
ncbi:DUF2262 domain-containing protein [Vreelandella venusta]|uniref:DUF2262 domain-containing protein n=1 Tax=Vreelandella venusta TaxID=44935 RepID=A0AAP9ZN13_9GAMM|nr:DUF2262 domain-containing protein [Halomonas venusta]QRL04242.1 DUF2262 domain-containing protein [Halomonas venusta]GEK50230.1 hypothetical protein HVE01_09510 [Halomonas venusta]